MSPAMDYISASDIYKLLHCQHWPYFDRFASPEEIKFKRVMPLTEIARLEHNVADEGVLVRRFFTTQEIHEVVVTDDIATNGEATLALMKDGVPVIYRGMLTVGEWTAQPDVLERVDSPSALGSWMYVPVDIKSNHRIEKYQKMQLAFYGLLLEKLQGTFPAHGAVLDCDGHRTDVALADLLSDLRQILAELERVRAGEKPALALRKSCIDNGPWGELCKRQAEERHDLALLANVDSKKIVALNSAGIYTIEQAAELDPVALDGTREGFREHGLQVIKYQAQALLERVVTVREGVELPVADVEIFFDIESDPPRDWDYLFGFLIRDADGERYVPFVAHTRAEEEKMWREFLAWGETLPANYHVYHFSPFEIQRLEILAERYGGAPFLETFYERMIDLKEITVSSVVFPLYFYGLKYIATFLGFSWSGKVTRGGQSVDVFEEYLKTGNTDLLEALIAYNRDDVLATAVLKDWLIKYAKEPGTYQPEYPWKKDNL